MSPVTLPQPPTPVRPHRWRLIPIALAAGLLLSLLWGSQFAWPLDCAPVSGTDGEQLVLYGRLRTGWGCHLVRRKGGGTPRPLVSGKRMFQVEVADVDGDGGPELLLGLFATTRYEPRPARRLHIYRLEPDGIWPKWLGSRLAHPFVDFLAVDLDGDGACEVVALEYVRPDRLGLAVYRWQGFGLGFLSRTGPLLPGSAAGPPGTAHPPILLEVVPEGSPEPRIAVRWHRQRIVCRWRDGVLEPVPSHLGVQE